MNPGNDEQLTKKTEQLNALLAENNELVNYIKECEHEIERLAWKIPEKGVEENIEELKLSVRVPMTTKKEDNGNEEREGWKKRIKLQYEDKMVFYLKHKKEIVSKL